MATIVKPKMATAAAAKVRSGSGSGFDWEDAATEMTRRCVFMTVYGDTGTGRTSLALSAPGPIAFLHALEKIDGIIEQHAHKIGPNGDGTGGVYNFGGVFIGNSEAITKQANEKWAKFKLAMDDAFGWARTIIVDTHTEAWELIRLARFGTLAPRGQIAHMYGPVNNEWRSMWKQFRQQETTNVIAIGQIGEIYKNDKATGKYEQKGQREMGYMSDVIVRTEKEKGVFTATVEKGWFNAEAEGIPLEDDMTKFPGLMQWITNIDAEEWGGD